ncbi:hypothetical protein [Gudongella sp. DL1XJH-153]|uniref:hypothetical protein n=1 Tax=Gudongella sp. DL1XJH-153 TaxID=3409804 RepID=UPI003BB611C7
MFKYVKYEMKGTMKFLIGAIILALGASTGIQLFIRREAGNTLMGGMQGNPDIVAFLLLALVFILIGSLIGAMVYLISSYRRELYEDRGYLTFSLPLSGGQLLGSKLLVALFWGTVMGLVIILYNLVLAQMLIGYNLFEDIWSIIRQVDNFGFLLTGSIITSLMESAVTLLLVYFAITVSRVSIKSKKIGSLWFILFIFLASVVTYIQELIAKLMPMYLDLSTMGIIGQREAYIMGIDSQLGGTLSIQGVVSIPGLLFQILLIVGAFFATAYMLDKKIDIV